MSKTILAFIGQRKGRRHTGLFHIVEVEVLEVHASERDSELDTWTGRLKMMHDGLKMDTNPPLFCLVDQLLEQGNSMQMQMRMQMQRQMQEDMRYGWRSPVASMDQRGPTSLFARGLAAWLVMLLGGMRLELRKVGHFASHPTAAA